MHAFNFRYSVNPISSVLFLTLLMLICNIAWGAEKDAEGSAENVTVNPFENGWKLDSSSSSLVFQTISNDTNSDGLSDDDSKIESHTFDTIDATVDENGTASLRIQLDSVETKDDLRNVRLRFLSFETYKFAEAIVSAKINPEALSTLSEKNRIEVPLEFELDFHGVKQTFQMQTIVMNLPESQVSVESAEPLSIETALFDLDSGVKKLENSSNQTIVPMAAVSFNLVFNTSAESTSNNDAEDKLAEGQEEDKTETEGADAEGKEADGKEAEGEEAKDTEAEGEEADGKEAR